MKPPPTHDGGTPHTYESLKTDKQTGEIILLRNLKPAPCPFRGPLPVPGQLAGQISLININCSSACPLFKLTVYDWSEPGRPQFMGKLYLGCRHEANSSNLLNIDAEESTIKPI